MITLNDYKVMEVRVNGEWTKQDVLKKLEDGTCLYLVGSKTSTGSYTAGGAIPGESYREIKRYRTVVKSAVDIMTILIANGYTVDCCGDWVHPDKNIEFDSYIWNTCGKEPLDYYNYEPEWLEEVEITEE